MKLPNPDRVFGYQEGGKTFNASLYSAKGTRPSNKLVVVVHEWWGANEYSMSRASMLAQAGHDALVVDLYGDQSRGDTPEAAMALAKPFYDQPKLGVERLKRFLALVKKDKALKNKEIVAVGYCFGGTQVLNLARSGMKLKAVVSFHGGLVTPGMKMKSAKTEVVVFHGESDPMVPQKDVDAFKAELNDSKTKLAFYSYPGATHAFTNPKATEVGKKYNLPVAYDETADHDSWSKLLTFLKVN